MTATPKSDSGKPASSKSAWFANAVHKGITLPSGTVVDIKIPNLPALVKGGQLPNELLAIAAEGEPDAGSDLSPKEVFEKMDELDRFLIPTTVINPQITAEEVSSLPTEDVDTIRAFALRKRDTDTVGHHLAGLEKVASFRKFRGLDSPDSPVLGV